MYSPTDIREVTCPKCGQVFIPAAYHAYRDGRDLYCSWKCFNHRYDGMTRKPRYKIAREIVQLTLEGEFVARHIDVHAAIAAVNGSENGMYKACHKGIPYKKFRWEYVE